MGIIKICATVCILIFTYYTISNFILWINKEDDTNKNSLAEFIIESHNLCLDGWVNSSSSALVCHKKDIDISYYCHEKDCKRLFDLKEQK